MRESRRRTPSCNRWRGASGGRYHRPEPVLVIVIALACSCALDTAPGQGDTGKENTASKIELDLDALDGRGLQGPPDGLRSMAYEFCIPGDQAHVQEVTKIDATVKVYRQSPGRIQCRLDQYLCVGETHQRNHRAVLHELASLPYVERVVPAYFE